MAGYDAATQTAPLRDRSSLARISDLVDLEPRLTVAESITERALIDAMPLQRAGERFEASCAALGGIEVPRKTLVGELTSLDQTLLAVALAPCGRPSWSSWTRRSAGSTVSSWRS